MDETMTGYNCDVAMATANSFAIVIKREVTDLRLHRNSTATFDADL